MQVAGSYFSNQGPSLGSGLGNEESYLLDRHGILSKFSQLFATSFLFFSKKFFDL